MAIYLAKKNPNGEIVVAKGDPDNYRDPGKNDDL